MFTPLTETGNDCVLSARLPMPSAESITHDPSKCFHCGSPCLGGARIAQAKPFCCQGCLTVFELLTENGLEDFYRLGQSAGVRILGAPDSRRFEFLDEPSIRERLADFSDSQLTRITFHIPAMHCVACVWLLENLFRLKPGIGESQVNFPRKEVAVAFSTARTKLSEVAALLASIGYEPELNWADLDSNPKGCAERRLWLQLGVAGFAFGNTMLFSIASYVGLDASNEAGYRKLMGYVSFMLAIPVVGFSALDYWKSAWTSLRQRLLSIDVPIAAGIAALFGQSAFEVISGRGEGYFDSLAGLLFFLLCGKLFQRKTFDRLAFDRDYKSFFPLSVIRLGSARASRAAWGASPQSFTVHLHPADGGIDAETAREAPAGTRACAAGAALSSRRREGACAPQDDRNTRMGSVSEEVSEEPEHVSLAQLQIGDRLLIRNGELIPADSRLIEGAALIDYSFVTGESEPVERRAGEYLYAGGRQIGGALEVEMTKAVSQSYLTSLWNQDAFRKEKGGAMVSLTNLYSRRFTRIIIGIALGASAAWAFVNPALSVKAFVSVLIVACPCALALAAPFALGNAMRVLARRDIFLRDASVLETLARVDAVIFDKTGTLTAATSGSVAFQGPPLNELEARWIHSMTQHSIHPHSVRIGESLRAVGQPEPVKSFRNTPGSGMECFVGGHEIWMGSGAWLRSRGIAAVEGCSASAVHVVIDGLHRGCFAIERAPRQGIDKLLRALGKECSIALLSGDNSQERGPFEKLFGNAAPLRFDQTPQDKLEFVQSLQKEGKTVMMVGDGLNDAGALKQSDVGVAVVERISAFSPASDVIMAADRVPQLSAALRFARSVVRVVRVSFLISAAYNVVGVSIAAGGMLSPVVCAVLMPVSSLTVVLFACGATGWLGRRLFRGEAREFQSAAPSISTEKALPDLRPAPIGSLAYGGLEECGAEERAAS